MASSQSPVELARHRAEVAGQRIAMLKALRAIHRGRHKKDLMSALARAADEVVENYVEDLRRGGVPDRELTVDLIRRLDSLISGRNDMPEHQFDSEWSRLNDDCRAAGTSPLDNALTFDLQLANTSRRRREPMVWDIALLLVRRYSWMRDKNERRKAALACDLQDAFEWSAFARAGLADQETENLFAPLLDDRRPDGAKSAQVGEGWIYGQTVRQFISIVIPPEQRGLPADWDGDDRDVGSVSVARELERDHWLLEIGEIALTRLGVAQSAIAVEQGSDQGEASAAGREWVSRINRLSEAARKRVLSAIDVIEEVEGDEVTAAHLSDAGIPRQTLQSHFARTQNADARRGGTGKRSCFLKIEVLNFLRFDWRPNR